MAFNLKILLQVAGLLLTLTLLAFCLLETRYYVTILALSLLLAGQLAALLHTLHASNRELSRFLTAIRHADFSQSFQFHHGGSYRELGEAFDGVMRRFREERGQKEEQALFLQTFVQQMPIAVFSLQEDGKVAISNQAFGRLTGLSGTVRHLDQVKARDRRLGDFIETLQPGRDQSLKLDRPPQILHLKFSCSLLRRKGRQQKLVTIQDIHSELEARELEAWQNLIRVMSHEIMNSITPIASLAGTTGQILWEAESTLDREGQAAVGEVRELLRDSRDAAATIAGRSQGLLRFVESYRSLTRLPPPRQRAFQVAGLFQSVIHLMQAQASQGEISLLSHCSPPTLTLHGDPELLEQALINLVGNALEAVTGRSEARIELRAAATGQGRVRLSVVDNGAGIDADNLDKVFIPFFTTKRGGSGIGLSLARQIARLHGGSLHLVSQAGEGTSVSLTF